MQQCKRLRSTMFIRMVFFWMFLELKLVSAFLGYDCGRSASNIITVSLLEVADCTVDVDQPNVENIELQLLQRIESESVENPCNYEYSLLYDGQAVKVGSNTITNPTIYFANSTEKIQFGLVKTGELNLCNYKMYTTDHPKLFITEYPVGQGIPAKQSLDVQDTVLTEYFNTKIAYLAKHIKLQFSTLYKSIILHRCELEREILQNALVNINIAPDMAALTIMRKPGYMAVPAGEIAHLVPCKETECKIRRVEECYQEIPVTCSNKSYFLKPFSRIMTRIGTRRNCNDILPTMHLIEGMWLKFSPFPLESMEPQILQTLKKPTWKHQNAGGLTNDELYTSQDLDRLHIDSAFPAERSAILEEVARKLYHRSSSASTVDFGNLEDQATFQSDAKNAIKKIWNGLTQCGIVLSGIMGIISLFTILKLLVDTLAHKIK